MKLVDEVIKIHEVIAGVVGELTTHENGHRHEIKVDDKGNGKTITVLNHNNEPIDQKHQEDNWGVKDHVHIIKNGEVQEYSKEWKDSEGKKHKGAHSHKASAKG